MTDEIRAVYAVGALSALGNIVMLGLSLVLSRRANNIKAVERHEQNFALLKDPLADILGRDHITLADKR